MEYIKLSKRERLERWHRWFAWFPVTVHIYPDGAQKKVWLKIVERCGTYHHYLFDSYWLFKYRETPNTEN